MKTITRADIIALLIEIGDHAQSYKEEADCNGNLFLQGASHGLEVATIKIRRLLDEQK